MSVGGLNRALRGLTSSAFFCMGVARGSRNLVVDVCPHPAAVDEDLPFFLAGSVDHSVSGEENASYASRFLLERGE